MPGRDIFLSYASEDRQRILPLVRGLEAEGWTVFWDRVIPAGRTWSEVLEAEITICRSVVVVWSEKSVKSEWVQEEAAEGKRRRVLVPVRIDGVDPPFGYRQVQAADLAGWDGTPAASEFRGFVKDLAALIGLPQAEPERRPAKAPTDLEPHGGAEAVEPVAPEVKPRRVRLRTLLWVQLACMVLFAMAVVGLAAFFDPANPPPTIAVPFFFAPAIAMYLVGGVMALSTKDWGVRSQGLLLPVMAGVVIILGILMNPGSGGDTWLIWGTVLTAAILLLHGRATLKRLRD